MGTNYYTVSNYCECCKRHDREHIGKSSAGWSFSFQGTDEIRDFDTWLANVKSAAWIVDEYGTRVTLDELLTMIDNERGGKRQGDYDKESPYGSFSQSWLDQYGNSFSGGDWS